MVAVIRPDQSRSPQATVSPALIPGMRAFQLTSCSGSPVRYVASERGSPRDQFRWSSVHNASGSCVKFVVRLVVLPKSMRRATALRRASSCGTSTLSRSICADVSGWRYMFKYAPLAWAALTSCRALYACFPITIWYLRGYFSSEYGSSSFDKLFERECIYS